MGRPPTFTDVAQFGAGIVPPLDPGLIEAAECASAQAIPPGEDEVLRRLAVGAHVFQCCIPPWVRALVKVEPEEAH